MKWFFLTLLFLVVSNAVSKAEYQHGYAFLSQLKYPQGFEHFAYVNPKLQREALSVFPRWARGIVLIPSLLGVAF